MLQRDGVSNAALVLFGSLLCAASLEPAFAQGPDDDYRLREDAFDPRKEGIKSEERIDVTSDKIAVLSALAMIETADADSVPPVLHLSIFAAEVTPATVNVSCEPKRYHVDPVRSDWGPGLDTFTWPTDIMREHRIKVGDLHARAIHIDQGRRVLLPALLHGDDAAGTVSAYSFVVAPLRRMTLRWWIVEAASGVVASSGGPVDLRADEEHSIRWECLGSGDEPASEGEYYLNLEGSYKPPLSRRKTVSASYRFRYSAAMSD